MKSAPVLWIDVRTVTRQHRLFGISTVERFRRSLARRQPRVILSGGAAGTHWPEALADHDSAAAGERLRRALAEHGPLIAIDGATAVDPRLLEFMRAADPCLAARGEGADRALVLRVDASSGEAIPSDAQSLDAIADALLNAHVIKRVDERDFPSYIDKLRRSIPFWIYRLDDGVARRRLERRLFWDNYKGSTDLLTAHVYPPLVWPAVRFCTRFRIHPNVVTALSIVLAFAAVPLFARAQWLAGFACAYLMSVLDSIDGKVARLTLTDSAIGNALDHGLDQIHPPFWYFAWAIGLGGNSLDDNLIQAAFWLTGFYVADRGVLAIAKLRLGHALHSSTRLDERVRGIIARRNITMTLMAGSLLMGVGAAGFYLVTAWQALTFAWHSLRTIWLGFIDHRASGEL